MYSCINDVLARRPNARPARRWRACAAQVSVCHGCQTLLSRWLDAPAHQCEYVCLRACARVSIRPSSCLFCFRYPARVRAHDQPKGARRPPNRIGRLSSMPALADHQPHRATQFASSSRASSRSPPTAKPHRATQFRGAPRLPRPGRKIRGASRVPNRIGRKTRGASRLPRPGRNICGASRPPNRIGRLSPLQINAEPLDRQTASGDSVRCILRRILA